MLVVTSDGKVYYGHVGDSRIYIVVNHQIIQLTKDHSYVQTLVDAGEISKEQAEHHPRKNEITNALGIPGMQPPTLCSEPIEPEAGNCFVLCSDGLSGMLDDRHIEHIVSKHEINIQQRTERLVQMANEAGGRDNITVQLLEFAVSSQKSTKDTRLNKKLLLVAGFVVVVILAVFLTVAVFSGKGNTDDEALNETVQELTPSAQQPIQPTQQPAPPAQPSAPPAQPSINSDPAVETSQNDANPTGNNSETVQ
jgi:protein phosphatase